VNRFGTFSNPSHVPRIKNHHDGSSPSTRTYTQTTHSPADPTTSLPHLYASPTPPLHPDASASPTSPPDQEANRATETKRAFDTCVCPHPCLSCVVYAFPLPCVFKLVRDQRTSTCYPADRTPLPSRAGICPCPGADALHLQLDSSAASSPSPTPRRASPRMRVRRLADAGGRRCR